MASPTYHLWLKPQGAAYELLVETIGELAHELNAPAFEPHITLLGHLDGTGQEHIRRTQQLARALQPFQVDLTEPSYRSEYFQCVFMCVDQTPPVMDANALARRVFQHASKIYMPHLSLVYGLYPETTKKRVIARLRPDLRTSFEVTDVYLIKADSDDPKDWHEILTARVGC
jgi:2'-5' RNA ligase